MESPGGGAGGAVFSGSNVPAFLTKLWTLVEDPVQSSDTEPLICWSPSGTSFHVFDQARFSKEVLPKFFKHSNMASFIRQLNMYGFRKVVHIEHGGLVKPERDDTEFQHPFFIRGEEHLLENIKRKVTNVSSVRQEEVKMSAHDVSQILSDVQLMKGKQETIDSRIIAMKHENEALWREMASLRQKHLQQQQVVNKLIQFLVSLVQSNRIMGAADSPVTSGPIISDITDVATPIGENLACDWNDVEESPIRESIPLLEGGETYVDTPLSPTTFINSILQESKPSLSTSITTAPPVSPASAGPPPSAPPPSAPPPSAPPPSEPPPSAPGAHSSGLRCQTIACIDRPRPPPPAGGLSPDRWRFVSTRDDKSELSNHLLSEDVLNGSESSSTNAGKQLVQYTPVPMPEPIGSGEVVANLPSLLELEAGPFFTSDPPTDDPAAALLSHAHLDSDLS
ncbi:Heat shock factor protein 1 [Liparis tanakae]|uniref:Heat shock factor protein 1 n=1 Tax=Liparis tanakae TaxID=230148 RepID=A0A4Z2FNM7_9TELE|nr:Heat shock factor protein 1 [Liparis tanakae]